MKENKNFLLVGILIVIMLVGSVMAQELNPPETITTTPQLNLASWFVNTFGIQQFSVVGDSRQCSITPDYTKSMANAGHYTGSASSICDSGYGLWDIFSPDYAHPYKEFRDNYDVTLPSKGIAQLYCCDHPECSSDSQCQDWVGEYSTCKTASCVSWSGGYKCTTDYGTETNIPYCKSSFKYCSQSIHKDCYYVSGSSCVKHTYPGVTSCPSSYQGETLYSSKSTCENNICEPVTCASLGKQCGTTSDGCGNTLTCGTCGTGTTCNSNGYCQSDTITEVPCTTASIDIIDIPCSTNTLDNCNSACPSGYIAGTVDSCGFHNCVLSSIVEIPTETPEAESTLDINKPINIGGTEIPLLYIIIGIAGLLILIVLLKK